MKRLPALVFLVFTSILTHAQQLTIDSLSAALTDQSVQDTVRVRYLNALAFAYRSVDPSKMMPILDHSEELALAINDRSGYGRAMHVRGVYYWTQSDYTNAFTQFQKAYDAFSEINDIPNMAKAVNNLGIIYHHYRDYESALTTYLKALSLKEQMQDRKSATSTLIQLGNLYSEQGDASEARRYYEDALTIAREYNDGSMTAVCLNNLGEILVQQNQLAVAKSYLFEALSIKKTMGDDRGISNTMEVLGHAHKSEQQLDSALFYFKSSLAIRQRLNDPSLIGHSYNHLAEVMIENGQYKEANEYLELAYEKAISTETKDLARNILRNYYQSFKLQGQSGQALEYYERYSALKDEFVSEERANALVAIQNRYDVQRRMMENEQLKANLEVTDRVIEQQRLQNLFILIIFTIAIVLLIVLLYLYQLKAKSNKELQTLNSEITRQKLQISKQSESLRKANAEIMYMNQHLEQLVADRTHDLEEKNQRLEEYNFLNAHQLRGPLTRIQSLVYVLDSTDTNQLDDRSFQILRRSVEELDDVIYSINDTLNEEA